MTGPFPGYLGLVTPREVALPPGLLGFVFNPTHGPGCWLLEVETLYSMAILFYLQAPAQPLASQYHGILPLEYMETSRFHVYQVQALRGQKLYFKGT